MRPESNWAIALKSKPGPGYDCGMDRRRLWHRIRRVWITLGLSATAVFVIWSLIAYRASAEAHAATRADSVVDVRHDDGIWYFAPRSAASTRRAGLVFFPGALVDPVAYAPIARAAAAEGFPSFIVELPRRGAFGGADSPAMWSRLRRLLHQPGMPPRWVAAGHSRGGVVASQLASDPPDGFAGLVLIGTSHPRDVDLSKLTVPVTKLAGTHDGLASRAEVEENRGKLPASTRWVWVEGGNHSQFGWYGFQPGDKRATIDASEQRAMMIRAVVEALTAARGGAPAE
ncbi:MAG: alpha/beta hydrolase [Geminicoccaceae bacterium]|nr:alpha/beta hydrolase [Geminicoccaceae bacterium]